MRDRLPKVAILGGGMAGLASAWRLSEQGWRDEFESITVYQRGWRLGGKGASSRGPHGRIEEHGLHVWLGWYENAFRLLHECYEELDRPTSRPHAPIKGLSDAFVPASRVGLADRSDGAWNPWVIDLPQNERQPGRSRVDGRDMTLVELTTQIARLVGECFDVQSGIDRGRAGQRLLSFVGGLPVAIGALGTEAIRLAGGSTGTSGSPLSPNSRHRSGSSDGIDERAWMGVALGVAALRGIVGDRLLTDPRGLAAINDEEYLSWVQRHGAPRELADFSVVRALYDLVFGFAGGDITSPSVAAGTAVLFGAKTMFDYEGSVFWKMTAGMGDVVFAPLYEALTNRGVVFEFFHRIDSLHPSADGRRIGEITVGRQALPLRGSSYEPLVPFGHLPCFPNRPLTEQLQDATGIAGQPLESHWCRWPDVERRVLREGSDFDVAVFAIPPGMAAYTCTALAADRPEWRAMFGSLGTIATQSFQLWLREEEMDLGWAYPGSTLTAFVEPFGTWASMPQILAAEHWPADDRPRSIAYFCGPLEAEPTTDPTDAATHHRRVRDGAIDFLRRDLRHLLPGAMVGEEFRWDLLCGGIGTGPARFDSQYWTANVDPSDRYVQSLPGTDRFRLRPDESGYDNLVLAGDWTDSGLNAGCIEAAVVSGLQAANAIRNRPRWHRLAGYFMP